jgi:hypothetical protein
MTVKFVVFWDITLCSLKGSYQRFGGTFCLHLQGKESYMFPDLYQSWWGSFLSVNSMSYDLLEKTVASSINAACESRTFIAVFTRACHWTMSRASWIQSIPSYISARSILILYSYVHMSWDSSVGTADRLRAWRPRCRCSIADVR